ncbi:hypothetical protein LCGC14_2819450 [marine sediment metagenome]|uniref:Uncharacterized protein n=1 Tax=marine sediment metagenome TaxID=412755 RepID=A0A0F8YHF3_9ZZZZ
MKIIPVALNHCIIELDNGEFLDVNDGTSVPKGTVVFKLMDPTEKRLIVATSITYDATVRISME